MLGMKCFRENGYLYPMISNKLTREEMWARQQICGLDVDYDFWNQRRECVRQMARMSRGCVFAVDVFKGRYDFASESFTDIFGYERSQIATIERQGDLLEDRIHPDDRSRLIDMQIQLSRFIYDLPLENRNDFRNVYQFRMLNARGRYVNVVSRQQVFEQDRKGKAWIVVGVMDVSPDQALTGDIKCSVLNLKTGEVVDPFGQLPSGGMLTAREKEILNLIRRGFLSKEIACRLGVSIYTVNNHRKNILAKLKVDNAMEAVYLADKNGWLR